MICVSSIACWTFDAFLVVRLDVMALNVQPMCVCNQTQRLDAVARAAGRCNTAASGCKRTSAG